MRRLIDADVLMATLGITDMDCDKCAWCDKEWNRCKRGGDFEDACFAIENAPTIELEQHWIPVTERLPERDGEYLVTIPNFRGDHIVTIRGYSSNLYALDRYAFRKGESGWYEYDSEYGFIGMNDFQSPKTLAWMPLPEPWDEEDE